MSVGIVNTIFCRNAIILERLTEEMNHMGTVLLAEYNQEVDVEDAAH